MWCQSLEANRIFHDRAYTRFTIRPHSWPQSFMYIFLGRGIALVAIHRSTYLGLCQIPLFLSCDWALKVPFELCRPCWWVQHMQIQPVSYHYTGSLSRGLCHVDAHPKQSYKIYRQSSKRLSGKDRCSSKGLCSTSRNLDCPSQTSWSCWFVTSGDGPIFCLAPNSSRATESVFPFISQRPCSKLGAFSRNGLLSHMTGAQVWNDAV